VDTPLGCDADVHLDGRGLILTPSIFVGDRPYLSFNLADPAAPATLTYPAINDLVTARRIWTAERPAGHLAALLGRTRSAILETIADGCGTVELARRLGISPASVSQHTAVLRNSGLIGTRRDGPSVIHVVTSLGAMLLDPHPKCRCHDNRCHDHTTVHMGVSPVGRCPCGSRCRSGSATTTMQHDP
jgi:DNA-binding transcriptional ArsR family regulator